MAMRTIELFPIDDEHEAADVPLPVGAGAVDPRLIEPADELEQQELEQLIAFRVSSL